MTKSYSHKDSGTSLILQENALFSNSSFINHLTFGIQKPINMNGIKNKKFLLNNFITDFKW